MTLQASVVIATRDKTSRLRLVLESLARQSRKDFEVHIVSDGGPPDSEALVHEFQGRININHHWCGGKDQESKGAAATRNVGFKVSAAPRIIVVDDDCMCPPNLIQAHCIGAVNIAMFGLRDHLAESTFARIGSSTWSENDWAKIHQLPKAKPEMRDNTRHLRAIYQICQQNTADVNRYFYTCHVSMPTAAVKAIGGMWSSDNGGFYGSSSEDGDLALRLHRYGVKFRFIDSPRVLHLDHPTCPRQNQHRERNANSYQLTVHDPRCIVRNGGPL